MGWAMVRLVLISVLHLGAVMQAEGFLLIDRSVKEKTEKCSVDEPLFSTLARTRWRRLLRRLAEDALAQREQLDDRGGRGTAARPRDLGHRRDETLGRRGRRASAASSSWAPSTCSACRRQRRRAAHRPLGPGLREQCQAGFGDLTGRGGVASASWKRLGDDAGGGAAGGHHVQAVQRGLSQRLCPSGLAATQLNMGRADRAMPWKSSRAWGLPCTTAIQLSSWSQLSRLDGPGRSANRVERKQVSPQRSCRSCVTARRRSMRSAASEKRPVHQCFGMGPDEDRRHVELAGALRIPATGPCWKAR